MSVIYSTCWYLVLVFSDVLVAFLYLIFAISGKYQNMEKLLKHQRRLRLVGTLISKSMEQSGQSITTVILLTACMVGYECHLFTVLVP